MQFSRFIRAIMLLPFLGSFLPGVAEAQIQVFTNRANWEAAVGSHSTEDFESDTPGNYPTPYTSSAGWLFQSLGAPITLQMLSSGLVNGSNGPHFRDFGSMMSISAPGGGSVGGIGFDYDTAIEAWECRVGGTLFATLPSQTNGFLGLFDPSGGISDFVLTSPSPVQGGISLDFLGFADITCGGFLPDAFEENDSCANAAALFSGAVDLNVSKVDEDWYRIDLPDGANLVVDALFQHSAGDIDLFLYEDCAGPAVDVSQGPNSGEQVSWMNMAGGPVSVLLQVVVAPGSVQDCNNYVLDLMIETPMPCVPLGGMGDVPPPALIIRNITPASWTKAVVEWNRDKLPQDKIDDIINANPAGLHMAIVNYRRCVTQADEDFLNGVSATSQVQMVCKYITSVAVEGVSMADLQVIAALPEVAFIEAQLPFGTFLDPSLQSIGVTAGFASPNTIEDACPTIDGTGVNIAIIDTGVDNDLHATFSSTPFIGGYDATLAIPAFVDPDDDTGHGTFVASVALGGGSSSVGRGVAKGSGLIDVKVIPAFANCATPGIWCMVVDGLETTYENRNTWNVGVINMSLGQCDASGFIDSDGTDSFSQLVDLADSMGIVVVAAAGNSGPSNTFMTTPGAASRSICVAASNDFDNPNPSTHAIASFSSQGPRTNDGDLDPRDELKPDITAPGQGIIGATFNSLDSGSSGSGTSFAAPMVAGAAAMIIQQFPGIEPASVRAILLDTATPRGTASLPGIDPVWNNRWGMGQLNVFAAVKTTPDTDVGFPSHPANPSWLSPDLTTVPFPAQFGIVNQLKATITNSGGVPALGVHVNFGITDYTASAPTFYHVGTKIVDFLPGETKMVFMDWEPDSAGHQCMKVTLGYGGDTDPTNNKASRNLNVAKSPVRFLVKNTVSPTPILIDFQTACEGANTNGWTISCDPPSVVLGPDDCPVEIQVLARSPMSAPNGEEIVVHVEANAQTFFGPIKLGGVSIVAAKKDCNGNSIDDYFDILNGTSLDQDANGIPDECLSPVGTPFCFPMNPNSTGLSTTLTGSFGSGVGSDLHLEVTNGVPTQFAYALVGTGTDDPGISISQGRLCLSVMSPNVFGRYNIAGSALSSVGQFDASGVLQNFVGTSTIGSGFDVPVMLPLPGSPNITAGSTWHFQVWHRENGGASNFSNGLSVTF